MSAEALASVFSCRGWVEADRWPSLSLPPPGAASSRRACRATGPCTQCGHRPPRHWAAPTAKRSPPASRKWTAASRTRLSARSRKRLPTGCSAQTCAFRPVSTRRLSCTTAGGREHRNKRITAAPVKRPSFENFKAVTPHSKSMISIRRRDFELRVAIGSRTFLTEARHPTMMQNADCTRF